MNLLILCTLLAAGIVLAPVLIQRAYRAPRIPEQGTPADWDLPYREARIETRQGKELFAWLIPADQDLGPAPTVLILHGWGGNAEQMLPFAVPLHRAGFAVLLFDARNHGRSDRDGLSSLPRFAEDLEDALDWVAQRPEVDPQRLAALGHSVGAGAVLLTASRRPELAAAISIAAFAHPEQLMERHLRSKHIPRPIVWLVLRFIEYRIQARFDDIAPCRTIRRAQCPVLLVHGEDDARVPFAEADQIHANRRDDRVTLLPIPDAGHESIEAIDRHADKLVAFLSRHIATDQPRFSGDTLPFDAPGSSSCSPADSSAGSEIASTTC
ncbi:alpha/beta hydrolase family protein [Thiorhodococcus fuscus]|uniref:Alpha/beta hydrolase family protein n=1 Tax=Thiorhodococcus fuscus TaxID=527200 RepID=A0ABW4Y8C0_9GAMM